MIGVAVVCAVCYGAALSGLVAPGWSLALYGLARIAPLFLVAAMPAARRRGRVRRVGVARMRVLRLRRFPVPRAVRRGDRGGNTAEIVARGGIVNPGNPAGSLAACFSECRIGRPAVPRSRSVPA